MSHSDPTANRKKILAFFPELWYKSCLPHVTAQPNRLREE